MVSTNLIHISKRLGKLDCRVARQCKSLWKSRPPAVPCHGRHVTGTGQRLDQPAGFPGILFTTIRNRKPCLWCFFSNATKNQWDLNWFINAQWCTSHSGSGWLEKKQLVDWNAEMQGDFGRSYSWNPLECHYHMILIYEKKSSSSRAIEGNPKLWASSRGELSMLPSICGFGGFPLQLQPSNKCRYTP